MRRSYAFLNPFTTKLEDQTQLAGIAQYSRVGHIKRFLPSYIPRQVGLDQSQTPHTGRYRSANGCAPHAQSNERVRTRWKGRQHLRDLGPSWYLRLLRETEDDRSILCLFVRRLCISKRADICF